MTKRFGVTRNFWVVITTCIVIGALFAYYLMVYVPNREELIYEKKIRELKRMARNIILFKEEQRKNLEGYIIKEAEKLEEEYKSIYKEVEHYETEYFRTYSQKEQEKIQTKIDSLFKKIDALDYQWQAHSLKFKQSPDLNDFEFAFHYVDKNFVDSWAKINLTESLKRYLFKNDSEEKYTFKKDSGNFLIIRLKVPESKKEVNSYTDLYTDTKTDATCCCCDKTEKEKKPGRKATVIFQNLENEVRLQNIDSLLTQKNGLQGSGVSEINLGMTRYKLFSHWLTLEVGDDLLLCSMEKISTIKSEAYSVEPWIIINTISIFLFLLLGMPLLKILIMNEVERLQISNVLFTGTSIILGAALIVLVINFTNHSLGYHYEKMDNDLQKISKSIKDNFLGEIQLIRKQIQSLKTNTKPLPNRLYDSSNGSLDTIITDYKPYNNIIWINTKGTITRMITSVKIDTTIQKLPVVNDREYFKAVKENNLWYNSAPSDKNSEPFYIDFVRSMLDGKFQVVTSTHLNSTKDVIGIALTTKAFSLQYADLPPGYQACIIDGQGEVKFHSTTSRSLQENFLEETDNEPELMAAISGRIAQNVSVTYDKQKYRAHIQPLDGMPLYLVVFYSIENYKAPIILSVWFTFGLILTLFIIILLHLLILFFIRYQPSKLKIRGFFLNWLRPEKLSHYRDRYIQSLAGGSLFMIMHLTLFVWFPVSRETIIGILLSPAFLAVFHFILYTDSDNTEKKSVRSKNIRKFIRWSVVLVLFVDVIALYLFDELNAGTWWLFLFQGLMALTLYIPFTKAFKAVQVFLFPGTGYKKLYLYSTTLWLVLVSFVPVFYFYTYSYEEESKIWLRHQQLETARKHIERQKNIKTHLAMFGSSLNTIDSLGDYHEATDEFMVDTLGQFPKPCRKDSRYNHFLFELTPPLSKLINLSGAQAFNYTPDTSWFWQQDCDTLKLFYKSGIEGIQNISVASIVPEYHFYKGDKAPLFWLAVIVSVSIFYRSIRFALRNIYGFDIIKPLHEVMVSADFFKLNENRKKNFFLIGLPYSGKGKLLDDLERYKKDQVLRINLQTQIEQRHHYHNQKIVIIEHFEFGLNNHELNKHRLKLLQEFQAKPQVQVILSSTVQPYVILDYYDRMESLTQHLKERDEFKNQYMEYKHAKRFWKSVLSGFVVIYLPLNSASETYTKGLDLIKTELSYGTFLPRLESHVTSQPVETLAEREDFILKVEDMAINYYESLWNSFSNAEKRLLYDLAVDRFVNMKNVMIVRTLLQKGVVVIDNSLQIFNKSFNNFILSAVREDEEMRMQQEVRSKGSWNSVQLVLILVFLAMGVFVAVAQRDILQHFNALMTALGGVTALLLRFGGLFTSNKPKD